MLSLARPRKPVGVRGAGEVDRGVDRGWERIRKSAIPAIIGKG
jgi:hypothetical protein